MACKEIGDIQWSRALSSVALGWLPGLAPVCQRERQVAPDKGVSMYHNSGDSGGICALTGAERLEYGVTLARKTVL